MARIPGYLSEDPTPDNWDRYLSRADVPEWVRDEELSRDVALAYMEAGAYPAESADVVMVRTDEGWEAHVELSTGEVIVLYDDAAWEVTDYLVDHDYLDEFDRVIDTGKAAKK